MSQYKEEEEKKNRRPWAENRARRFFSRLHSTFKLSTFRAMTTSQICCCLCFSIAMVAGTTLMKTAIVISKREQKNCCWCSFVCPHRSIYTCTHTSCFCYQHRYFIHTLQRKKKTRRRRKKKGKKKEKMDGWIKRKRRRSYVRLLLSFSLVLFLVARFIVALRRVPRPPGASSLLSVSRIIVISSRQQAQQQ